MQRRSVFGLAIAAIGLAAALAPWSLPSDRLTGWVRDRLGEDYGLQLSVVGPVTVSLLPTPRIKLPAVTMRNELGAILVEDAAFRGEIAILPLLAGRLRFAEMALRRPRIHARFDESGESPWAPVFSRLGRPGIAGSAAPHVRRIVLTEASFAVEIRAAGVVTELSQVDAVLTWTAPGQDIDLAGSGTWRDEALTFSLAGIDPLALLAGGRDGVELKVESRHARLTLSGDLTWVDGPSFAGLVMAETPSVSGLVAWTGFGPHPAAIDRALTVSGDATLSASGLDAPRVNVGLGPDRLDGSLSVAFGGARPKVRATLAGGQIDLGWATTWTTVWDGAWRERIGANAPLADYDLRLSASGVRLGALSLKDAAAGLLIGRDRLDLSVARAGLAEGTIKGRLSAELGAGGRDVKGQLTLDRVDLGALLGELGHARVATGTVAGQASFGGSAGPRGDLARSLSGRVTLVARDGELSGVMLPNGWRRADSTSSWRGGRTVFEQAQMTISVANGIAEIAEGSIEAGPTHTTLEGRLSLADRFLSLRTTTRGSPEVPAADGRATLVLDVNGPLDRLIVMPSSGAAPAAFKAPR